MRNKTVKLQSCHSFANIKEKTPSLSQSSVVYKFSYPFCSYNYIGKTERTLYERIEDFAYSNKKSNKQNAIYEHLSACPQYSHILNLFNVNNNDANCNKFNINQIRSNTIVN